MTPRFPALDPASAPTDATPLLRHVERSLGMLPNLHRTLAHSPAALRFYSDMNASLAGGALRAPLREQIAVAVAARNGCGYCASAHTTIGKSLRIDGDELARNLEGRSDDPRTQAALDFAGALLDGRGDVPDAAVEALRTAGFVDAEIIEIVAHVGLNLFTNYFNAFARTTIDFPEVELSAARG